MQRRLLILSYWFPPSNAIGASRAVALAHFFRERGWDVTVVCADSSAVSSDFEVDLKDLKVFRVPEATLTRYMNIRPGRGMLPRVMGALARLFAFPDVFSPTTKAMRRMVEWVVADQGGFDVVISTALPFSQHVEAAKISARSNSFLVLDNRDFWADNIYRRRLPFSQDRERKLERKIFSFANLITAISESMADQYKANYPEFSDRVVSIRNGVDRFSGVDAENTAETDGKIEIIYTGILYGNKRDVTPILEAMRLIDGPASISFIGSESEQVSRLARTFSDLDIKMTGRVSRDEAIARQRDASTLLVALGSDEAERTFLPGKFFEYVGTGLPIIVLADQEFEVSRIVDEFGVGIATRDPVLIAEFLAKIAAGKVARRSSVPRELTRRYQLELLERSLPPLDNWVSDRLEEAE